MPKKTNVTYEKVAEVAESLVSKGLVPTVDAVIAVTGGRRDYVRQHLKSWRNKKAEERKASISKALNERFAKNLHEDREEYARNLNALQQDELDCLENDCESMEREISGLYIDCDELKDLLVAERKDNEEQISALALEKSNLEKDLGALQAQKNVLTSELQVAQHQLENSNKRLAGMSKSLGQYSSEAKSEGIKARKLEVQLDEYLKELESVKAELNAMRSENKILGCEISRMVELVEQLRRDYSTETQMRIKSEKLCAVAKARAETLQEEIDVLAKIKRPKQAQTKKSARKPMSKTKASTQSS